VLREHGDEERRNGKCAPAGRGLHLGADVLAADLGDRLSYF